MRIRDGKRQSVFRAYVFPHMDQPNLTVLPHALVTRLTFQDNRTTGVEISFEGSTRRIHAGREVILSLGAIHTPKVLMQSGVGDQTELRRFGIPVVQHPVYDRLRHETGGVAIPNTPRDSKKLDGLETRARLPGDASSSKMAAGTARRLNLQQNVR